MTLPARAGRPCGRSRAYQPRVTYRASSIIRLSNSRTSLRENYLLDDEDEPLGLLEEDEPPPIPPLLLEEEPPLIPPLVEEPPIALPDVPPVPEPELVVESVLGELGELGAVEVEDDDEPPGTTTVSFSRVVVVDVDPLGAVVLPPGTTVVVSFLSQADNANAPNTANSTPLRLMFTLLSSEKSLQNASTF
jgi:hypothetical protein